MGILRRLADRAQSLRRSAGALVAERLHGESLALAAEIPGTAGGPLCQLRVEMQSEPEAAGGERLRLRAHLRLSLRRALGAPGRDSAEAPANDAAPKLPARVGAWLERRLQSRLVQALASPLIDREVNTWVELQASTAPLDAGSKALLPERLGALGIRPRDGQIVETWAGAVAGPRPGYAAMTLLRMDKRQLPPELQRALGDEPFQLTAAVVNVVEDAQ